LQNAFYNGNPMTALPDPEKLESEALHALGQFAGASVLEVGCGDGRLMRHYAGQAARVIGLDPDHDEIALAKKEFRKRWRSKIFFHLADAGALPYPAASFDLVVLAWSL
jgi:ubiquinone/menaquinone biosynthesis C-methylase UbiE